MDRLMHPKERWKDPWYKNLPPLYRNLWDYIYDDSNYAGIWIVDVEVASVRIDKENPIDTEKALKLFNEFDHIQRIYVIDQGRKWWMPSKIYIQNQAANPKGKVSENASNVHKSLIQSLNKEGLFPLNQKLNPGIFKQRSIEGAFEEGEILTVVTELGPKPCPNISPLEIEKLVRDIPLDRLSQTLMNDAVNTLPNRVDSTLPGRVGNRVEDTVPSTLPNRVDNTVHDTVESSVPNRVDDTPPGTPIYIDSNNINSNSSKEDNNKDSNISSSNRHTSNSEKGEKKGNDPPKQNFVPTFPEDDIDVDGKIDSTERMIEYKNQLLSEFGSIPTQFDKFIKYFRVISGKKNLKGDSKAERNFRARIKEGYRLADIMKATENLFQDDWHIKQNFDDATPEFITRPDKLEKYFNVLDKSVQVPPLVPVEELKRKLEIKKKTKEDLSLHEKYSAFLHQFNKINNKQFKGTTETYAAFRRVIDYGYSWEDVVRAIKQARKDPVHIENNYINLTVEYMTRIHILEKYSNAKIQKK